VQRSSWRIAAGKGAGLLKQQGLVSLASWGLSDCPNVKFKSIVSAHLYARDVDAGCKTLA
jgi:hypothetical protein